MRLYLDACAIIYAIEGAEPFHSAVLRRVTEVESLTDGVLLTSRLSLLECRVKPIRQNNAELLARYDDFFTTTEIEVVEISSAVIDRATILRAEHNVKTAAQRQNSRFNTCRQRAGSAGGRTSYRRCRIGPVPRDSG
jgi:predicted nucleic acid-binding protein